VKVKIFSVLNAEIEAEKRTKWVFILSYENNSYCRMTLMAEKIFN
jgi:hypothetical protein